MPTSETFQKPSVKLTLLLILIAYLFSFAIRLIWVWHFKDTSAFYWNGQMMINTNDGYYFASGVQKALWGMHADNPLVPASIWDRGLIFITSILVKIFPLSFETIILYMPAIFSGLIVVPLILLGRLYGNTVWGFLAALLASITWSYYNRTMIGYYDSDLLALIVPFFALYFLIRFVKEKELSSMLYASLVMAVYPFLYDPAKPIVAAMALFFLGYIFAFHRKEDDTYKGSIILFASLLPLPIVAPLIYAVHVLLAVLVYFLLVRRSFDRKYMMAFLGILVLLFVGWDDATQKIYSRILGYTITGVEQSGLHFYNVVQTIREAGKIPFETFANRIAGSQVGLMIALIGYIVLVVRHRPFLLALPLVGIGAFAYWGGLRFTVYAVPVAALGSVYLFWVIGEFFRNNKAQYLFAALATLAMLYPNIRHVIDYRVPTVFNKSEVTDLDKLKHIANSKDYTLTWWDYAYPIWLYSDTSTLIDGGKHNHDNFIISKILQTNSPKLAASLARLSVETYAKGVESHRHYRASGKQKDTIPPEFKFVNAKGEIYHAGKKPVANVLFRDKQPDQKDPNLFLDQLKKGMTPLPQKTRDIYLYLPYRMMGIFPTVMVFGNIDLTTGKPLRNAVFYPTSARGERDGQIVFANGMIFDARKGILHMGSREEKVGKFVITQNRKDQQVTVKEQAYHFDGSLIVVYMKSYGRFVVMDRQTFGSMYVQMFMLGRYDKRYFEPVVLSPYSRIYRIKI